MSSPLKCSRIHNHTKLLSFISGVYFIFPSCAQNRYWMLIREKMAVLKFTIYILTKNKKNITSFHSKSHFCSCKILHSLVKWNYIFFSQSKPPVLPQLWLGRSFTLNILSDYKHIYFVWKTYSMYISFIHYKERHVAQHLGHLALVRKVACLNPTRA